MTPTEEVYLMAALLPQSRMAARADLIAWLLSLPDRKAVEDEARQRLTRTKARIAWLLSLRSPYRGQQQSGNRPCWAKRRRQLLARLRRKAETIQDMLAVFSFAALVAG